MSGRSNDVLAETLTVFEDAATPCTPLTTSEVAADLECTRRTAYDRLQKLTDRGDLRTKKVGARGRVWWREPNAATDDSAVARSLVDAVDEYAIVALDADGRIASWNDGAARLYGYERDDVLEEHVSTLYADGDATTERPGPDLAEAADGGLDGECRHVRADGSTFRAHVTITPMGDEDGGRGYAQVTRDVTERHERECDLREEKAFADSLLDNQRDVVYAFDDRGELLRWNDRLSEVSGYTDAEIATMRPLEFVAEETTDDVETAIHRVIAHGEGATVEAPLSTADGTEIPYEFSGAPIYREDGSVAGLTGVGRDVSERVRRERQLERERDLVERVFESSPVALMVFDSDGRLVRANDRAATHLGGDLDGYSLGETRFCDVDGELLAPSETPLGRTLATGEPVSGQRVAHADRPASERRWFSVTTAPIRDEREAIDRVVVSAEDVTQLERQSRRLERQRDDLERELDEVFERIDDAFYAVDQEFRFTYVNERAEQLLQRPARELLGESVWELFSETAETEAGNALRASLERQEPTSYERYSDQLGIWIEASVYPSESGLSVYFRDVTERKERERERELYERIVETVDDGVYAIDEASNFVLANEAFCEMAGFEREELVGRHATAVYDDVEPEAAEKAAEVAAGDRNIATLELELEASDGERIPVETRFCPFPYGDGEGRCGVVRDVSERLEREQELVRQREQLAALTSLDGVVRDITDAVIDKSTREEIERTVCEALADSNSYEVAWVGEVDPTTDRVTPRAEAGSDGYVDDIAVSADPDDPRGQGPAGTALRTGDSQVLADTHEDPSFEPWREQAERYGYRSGIAIPIVYEETTYGVLCVYASRPDAFAETERIVLSHLGEIVGHAIGAVERKRALMGDEVVEVEFLVENVFERLDVSEETDGTITLDQAVPVGDDEFLLYGTASADAADALDALVEELPYWKRITVDAGADAVGFELLSTEPPILSVVASLGGYVDGATIADGDYRLTVHLSPGVDVRRLTDAVRETYPTASLVRRQQVSQSSHAPERLQYLLANGLTDRQRTALEVAYHSGFFEWPRESSGEEIAASIGVSSPTFHQHLRKAEGKVFDALLGSNVDPAV